MKIWCVCVCVFALLCFAIEMKPLDYHDDYDDDDDGDDDGDEEEGEEEEEIRIALLWPNTPTDIPYLFAYLGLVHCNEVLISDEERQVKPGDRFPPENFKVVCPLLKEHDVLFREKLFQVVGLCKELAYKSGLGQFSQTTERQG